MAKISVFESYYLCGRKSYFDYLQFELLKMLLVKITIGTLKRWLNQLQRKFERKMKLDIRKATISLLLKHLLNVPLQNEKVAQQQQQSIMDDAQEISQLPLTLVDNVFQPIFKLILVTKSLKYLRLRNFYVYLPLPICCFILYRMQSKYKSKRKESKKQNNSSKQQLQQLFQRFQLTKLYNQHCYEIKRITAKMDNNQEQSDALQNLRQLQQTVRRFSSSYREITSNLLILREIFNGHFNKKEARNFLQFCSELYKNALDFIDNITSLRELTKSIDDVQIIFDALQETPHMCFWETLKWLSQMKQAQDQNIQQANQCDDIQNQQVILNDICLNYDQLQVLTKFNYHFTTPINYAITGPSGCGKSTLAGLLVGINNSYSGEIKINGVNIRAIPIQQLRKIVTLCSQNDTIISDFTLQQNITYGECVNDERIANLQKICGIDFAKPNDIINELSGGQKQRIALARALYRYNTKVLILDETTSALDNDSESIIVKEIQTYCKQNNILLIFIAHRQLVVQAADQVVNIMDINQNDQ